MTTEKVMKIVSNILKVHGQGAHAYSLLVEMTVQHGKAMYEEGVKDKEQYADQVAQESAKGFAEWLRQNAETANSDLYYYKSGGVYTVSQLYDIYFEHFKKQK